jgi:hypothetical protein
LNNLPRRGFQAVVDVLKIPLTAWFNVFAYGFDWHPKITGFPIIVTKINGVFLTTVAMKMKHPWAAGGPCTRFVKSSEKLGYLPISHC